MYRHFTPQPSRSLIDQRRNVFQITSPVDLIQLVLPQGELDNWELSHIGIKKCPSYKIFLASAFKNSDFIFHYGACCRLFFGRVVDQWLWSHCTAAFSVRVTTNLTASCHPHPLLRSGWIATVTVFSYNVGSGIVMLITTLLFTLVTIAMGLVLIKVRDSHEAQFQFCEGARL